MASAFLRYLLKTATPDYRKILEAAAKSMAPNAPVTENLVSRAASTMGVSKLTEPSRESLRSSLRQFSETFPKGKRDWGSNISAILGGSGQLLAPDAGVRRAAKWRKNSSVNPFMQGFLSELEKEAAARWSILDRKGLAMSEVDLPKRPSGSTPHKGDPFTPWHKPGEHLHVEAGKITGIHAKGSADEVRRRLKKYLKDELKIMKATGGRKDVMLSDINKDAADLRLFHGSPSDIKGDLKPKLDARTGEKGVFLTTSRESAHAYALLANRAKSNIDHTTKGGKFISGSVETHGDILPKGYIYEFLLSEEGLGRKASKRGFGTEHTRIARVPVAPVGRSEVTREIAEGLGWTFSKKLAAEKNASDLKVLTAIPAGARKLVEQHGLLSSEAILKNPEVLKAVVASRAGTQHAWKDEADFIRSTKRHLKDKFWGVAKKGPSVFFGPPDPSKVGPQHPMNVMKSEMVRINLSRLLRKEPKTVIHGSELIPYDPKGPKHQGDLRHHPITLDEARAYAKQKPKELWKHYSDPEGKRYAGGVPHAQIVTPSGAIPREFLEFM